MRNVILSMQTSIDGFIEGENGDMSWMYTDEAKLWDGVFEMIQTVDTLVLGRVMYPGYRDYWKNCLTDTCSDDEKRYAKWADKTQHIVFSKTMKEAGWANTTINSSSPVEEVTKMKSQKTGGDIYIVGGAMLARTLADAGLVDEYRLTVCPEIVRAGKSLWNPLNKAHSLDLMSVEKASATVVLTYREKR